MFCTECGKEVREGAKFCPYCGKPIKTAEKKRSTEKKRSADKSIWAIVLRVALIVCVIVVPWFELNYYVGNVAFNFFSMGSAVSKGAQALRSIASISGASVNTYSIDAFSLFCIALALVPVVYLSLDIRTYLKKGLLKWDGPIAVIIILVLGLVAAALITWVIDAWISNGLSSSIQLDVVSVSAGWWITVVLVAVTIWVDQRIRSGKRIS